MEILDAPSLHLLVYWSEEDSLFYSRCLDLHVLGHGQTAREALQSLQGAIECYLESCHAHGIQPFRRAPEEYWQMYYEATEKRLRHTVIGPREPAPYALAV